VSLDIIAFLAVIGTAGWLGLRAVMLFRVVTAAIARVQTLAQSEVRLRKGLEALRRQEEPVLAELNAARTAVEEQQKIYQKAERTLVEARLKSRRRLIVAGERRQALDRDWIVTVTNPLLGAAKSGHPLAEEWRTGRQYLVWAPTAEEAGSRLLRRLRPRRGGGETVVAAVEDGGLTPPGTAPDGGGRPGR